MTFDIEVNNKTIKARKGETILSALNRNGINVPTLCYMQELSPTGNCRLCVVEIEGTKNLIPSCAHPVSEGMRIKTHSTRVINARKAIIELLLANHPADCLYCERNKTCELQTLSYQLNIRNRHTSPKKSQARLDVSGPSFTRDLAKCILCGRCVRICDEMMHVSAIDFINRGNKTSISPSLKSSINISSCINCGQCVINCPTGALIEKSHIERIQNALSDPNKKTVAIVSPSVGISIAEDFGLKPGKDYSDLIVAALKKIGIDKVADMGSIIDFHAYSQAKAIERVILKKADIPVISSSCISAIKFIKEFYPELSGNLFQLESPQKLSGYVIKELYSKDYHYEPENIFTISIMPCISAKQEANESSRGLSTANIDAVISIRELIKLIHLYGIDMNNLDVEKFDEPFRMHSSASSLYEIPGGQSEAVLRNLNYLIEKTEKSGFKTSDSKSLKNIKEITVKLGRHEIKAAICSGTQNAKALLDEIKSGKSHYNYIEFSACNGGCINGGGQPIQQKEKLSKVKLKTLSEMDEGAIMRYPFHNPIITALDSKINENQPKS